MNLFTKSLVVAALALCGTLSQAQAISLKKSFDGKSRYCPANAEAPVEFGEKILSVRLEKASSAVSDDAMTLAVSVVRCEQGQWVNDPQPFTENYIAPNGAAVKVTYNNYKFFVMNQQGEVVLQTELDNPDANGTHQLLFKIDKEKETSRLFDLVVTVEKTVSASDGTQFTRQEAFGSFKLQLQD